MSSAAPTDTRDRMSHLVRTLGAFWPPPSAVVEPSGSPTSGMPAAGDPTGAPGQEFIVVPHARAPRLLVPAQPRRVAAAAMLRYSHALSNRERVTRSLGSIALLAGADGLLHDRVRVSAPEGADSIAGHLSNLFGEQVLVAVGIGKPRANQKPVLQVFNRRGRRLAYVKVGDTPLARQLVRGEAEALRAVSHVPWTRLRTPEVLHAGPWRDLEILVLSVLPTTPLPRTRSVLDPPVGAMAELTEAFDEGEVALGTSAFWSELRLVAQHAPASVQRRRFELGLETVEDSYADSAVRVGAWHGDWAPWNMTRQGSRVLLWDWERFARGVPQGLDPVHYVVQTVVRSEGMTPAAIRRGLARVPEQPPSAAEAPARLLYLLAIGARYLQGCHGEGGDLVRPLCTAVLDVLAEESTRGGRRC